MTDALKCLKRNSVFFAFGLSVLFHFILLLAVNLIASHHSWFWMKPAFEDAPLLEAEILDQRPPSSAHENSISAARPKASRISKNSSSEQDFRPHSGSVVAQENTASGELSHTNTRGPVVDFAPAPKLPVYLKNENLKSSVVIEFMISQMGQVVPRLLSSSGNEELDVLALKTALTWKIRPAIREGKPIDSRVRLRINFEVE